MSVSGVITGWAGYQAACHPGVYFDNQNKNQSFWVGSPAVVSNVWIYANTNGSAH